MHNLYNKIIGTIRNTKIKTRIIAALLTISIIPILLVGYISFQNSSSAIRSKISTYSVQVLNETSKNIYSKIEGFDDFGDELCYSGIIQNSLEQYAKSRNSSYFQKDDIVNDLNNYIFSRTSQLTDIYDIEILGEDQTLLYGMGYHTLSERNVQKYAELAARKTGTAAWSYDCLNGNNTIVFAKQIYSLYGREKIGYLIMEIQEKSFAGLYNSVEAGEGTNIFIIDQTGVTVSSKNSEAEIGTQSGGNSFRSDIESSAKSGSSTIDRKIGGKQSLVAFSYIKDTDWYLVCTIPYSYLNRELSGILWQIVVVCVITVLLCIVLAFLISRSIVLPLNRLVVQMKRAKTGELAVLSTDYKNDEVGYLQQSYNSMIVRIGTLIEQNQKEQTEKREMEIQMLQAQITPHFLFNALNSLRWAAKMSQAESVSDGIGALARLLKNTILNTSETVPLRAELKNVDDYATIQKIRYGTFFTIRYDIPDEIKNNMILKFLLQPLVENAIIHSHEGVDHHVLIQISGMKKEDQVSLSVSDNGKGMDEQTVGKILNSKRGARSNLSGIGIGNVRDRIKLCFGEKYGLNLESKPGVGTTVTIRIPVQVQNGDERNVSSPDSR